jgi:hypothetical protein
MKYFTREWWRGDTSGNTAKEYWSYIDAIRPKLTKDLVRLLDDVSLHDSTVHSFLVTPEENVAVLVLDGSSDPWHRSKGLDRARRFALRYEGVTDVTIVNKDRKSISQLDDSDLGYDEIELTPNGMFQHRMLFASYTELHMTFKNFRLEFKDKQE